LAAELESKLNEDSELIKSSGGVFEIEYKGTLIFSKKALGRFPIDGEVLNIVQALAAGVELEEAQHQAALHAPDPISFVDWLKGKLFGKQTAQK
jgi:selenoprotein W-related protein